MTFESSYQILINLTFLVVGLVLGRLSMAIQYAIMKDISKKKKQA